LRGYIKHPEKFPPHSVGCKVSLVETAAFRGGRTRSRPPPALLPLDRLLGLIRAGLSPHHSIGFNPLVPLGT
jgi:hypothetical protein